MLVVEMISKIRRMHFGQGMGIKTICRELTLSKKVVREVVRSGATGFGYRRTVQPRPKLCTWLAELDRLLAVNAARASRERLTVMQLYEELRGPGYDGRRRRPPVCRDVEAGTGIGHRGSGTGGGPGTVAAFVPLTYAPGEAYQFDRSHEVVLIDGICVTVKVALVRLCHRGMFFVRAYPRETQETVLDAHDLAFAFFHGTCTRGIHDNMKTAVDTIFVGKNRAYNRRFLQMYGHYLVYPVACPPASGREKGKVQSQVGTVRQCVFSPRLRVKSYEALNALLIDKCIARAKANRHPEMTERTVWDVFEAERPQLVPHAGRFDGFHSVPAAVSKTCLVRFDNNEYSVMASAVGRTV